MSNFQNAVVVGALVGTLIPGIIALITYFVDLYKKDSEKKKEVEEQIIKVISYHNYQIYKYLKKFSTLSFQNDVNGDGFVVLDWTHQLIKELENTDFSKLDAKGTTLIYDILYVLQDFLDDFSKEREVFDDGGRNIGTEISIDPGRAQNFKKDMDKFHSDLKTKLSSF